jgi:hypothetical protein
MNSVERGRRNVHGRAILAEALVSGQAAIQLAMESRLTALSGAAGAGERTAQAAGLHRPEIWPEAGRSRILAWQMGKSEAAEVQEASWVFVVGPGSITAGCAVKEGRIWQ